MIKTEELTRTYGDFVAVDRVSFSIGKGEIVGLLGHNGAGKTTIMKMLTGFLEPTSGIITIDGHDPQAEPLAIRKKIGYLPENCPVYPEMTVVEYLDFTAGLHGIPDSKRPDRLRDTIVRTGLADKADKPISTLSRGYRQRVGVAQAIIHQPKILILDEPTNGLDPTQIQHMRSLIMDLAKHSTIIVSTHILHEVQAVCSRVMIIRSGKMALDSRLDELTQGERLLVSTNADSDALRADLKEIEQVRAIDLLSSTDQYSSYGLTLAENSDNRLAATRIAESILAGGHHLYELSREQQNLEALFGKITADERRMAS